MTFDEEIFKWLIVSLTTFNLTISFFSFVTNRFKTTSSIFTLILSILLAIYSIVISSVSLGIYTLSISAFLLCFAPITFIGPVVYLLVDSILAPSATFSRKSLCILLPGLTGLVFSLTAMQHSDTEMIAMVQSYAQRHFLHGQRPSLGLWLTFTLAISQQLCFYLLISFRVFRAMVSRKATEDHQGWILLFLSLAPFLLAICDILILIFDLNFDSGILILCCTSLYALFLLKILLGEANRRHEMELKAEIRLRESQAATQEARLLAAKWSAIASLTQSLAHDVRKPFSMLKLGIERMASVGDDPAEARSLARKIREHVGQAFDEVNGMIADVLDVASGHTNLHLVQCSIASLLDHTLRQTLRYHADTKIALTYELKHSYLIKVDSDRIKRVIANILDNARQALKGGGRIWVSTRDISAANGPMVELAIGNSDSFISPDILKHIFDAFFTIGKADGTGLGLAICHKFIIAHGGTIYCKSDVSTGTEFFMTLPAGSLASQSEQQTALNLPSSSMDIHASFERSLNTSNG